MVCSFKSADRRCDAGWVVGGMEGVMVPLVVGFMLLLDLGLPRVRVTHKIPQQKRVRVRPLTGDFVSYSYLRQA